MKATLSAKALKAALKTVKTITDTYENAKGDTLYGVSQDEKGLWLRAAGGFLVSTFLTDKVSEPFDKLVPVDAETLNSLKFPSDEVEISYVSGGGMLLKSGSLEIELARPMTADVAFSIKGKDVPAAQAFEAEPFRKALAFHTYGTHHNPVEAGKRLVRLTPKDGRLHLLSFDKQVSAFNSIPFSGDGEPIFVVPKPITVALANVAETQVGFGVSERFWRITTPTLDVIYPNMVRPVVSNFERLLENIATKPCRRVTFSAEHISKTLGVLTPSIKAGKEENPRMHLYVKPGENVQVTVASDRIKSMKFQLEGQMDGVTEAEAVGLNFRYTREFVDNLGGDVIHFQYWKFQDPEAPVGGRAVSFYNESGRYIIGRLTL